MAGTSHKSHPEKPRRGIIISLALAIFVLGAIVFSEQAFNLTFLRPNSNEQTLIFAGLSLLIFLLLVLLTFVLLRTLLKLYAERRSGALGARFRTRMVWGALVLSLTPVMFLFIFAYGLMNRTIDKWFSRPLQEIRQDTAVAADLLTTYAANDARSEARSIAFSPVTQSAFASRDFASLQPEFERHEVTLNGGFVIALDEGRAQASFHAPDWKIIQDRMPPENQLRSPRPPAFAFAGQEYMLGIASVGRNGRILVGLPLPANFSTTLSDMQESERQYYQLRNKDKDVRRVYMGVLWLLTLLVMFASTWFALFLSKFVTRPVAALAAATEEISRGRFDYRIEVAAGDELGKLVQSFNRMAQELEVSRRNLEASSQSLSAANTALEQRRRQMEIILESIPTGVLSLDAQRMVMRTNTSLQRIFHSSPSQFSPGSRLDECLPAETVADLGPMLRKADRMGSVTSQMEIDCNRQHLDLAVTVASLHDDRQRLGYVLVFEDLSDLLHAQKQAAWREVARRVAHEIKNPLTPIALSAERIRRHLERDRPPDEQSVTIMRSCAQTIGSAVETVRTLVDEFSTLARFPSSQPRPADINGIIENTLALFDGRLDGITVRTELAPDLPRVLADPEAMKRALANLVDNAAEATRDTMLREIYISSALVESKDGVELVVADTGHGVSQELKERLFLPYFSTKKRGTGLGLAIVSRIIEDHHGSIRVEENSPVGAKFILELPIEEAASTQVSAVSEQVVSTSP